MLENKVPTVRMRSFGLLVWYAPATLLKLYGVAREAGIGRRESAYVAWLSVWAVLRYAWIHRASIREW